MKGAAARKRNASVPAALRPSPNRKPQWFEIMMVCYLFYLLFLSLFPFSGLFNGRLVEYQGAVFGYELIGALMLAVMSVFLYSRWRPAGWPGGLSALAWALPLCYWMADVRAVSPLRSEIMLYANVVFACLFVCGVYLLRHKIDRLFQTMLFVSGYAVVLFGLLHWFGFRSFHWLLWLPGKFGWIKQVSESGGIYIFQDAVMQTVNGIRLTSVFQYANTYSALLLALWLLGTLAAINAPRRSVRLAHGVMAVLVLLSLLLTLSRGGLVVLPVAVLCVLPFLSLQRQLHWLILMAASGLGALAVLGPANTAVQAAVASGLHLTQWDGWGWTLLAGLAAGAVFAYADKPLSLIFRSGSGPESGEPSARSRTWRQSHWLLPVCSAAAGLAVILLFAASSAFRGLLPEFLRERLQNINFNQHSVIERGYFFADAIKIWKDYPVFGAGGGAWETLFQQYQEYPYVSQQVHNYFFQVLVETGAVGFAAMLALLAAVYWRFIRLAVRERRDQARGLHYYVLASALLLHSAIDFNMSYFYIASLVFLAMGGMVGSGLSDEAFHVPRPPGKTGTRGTWHRQAVRKAFPAMLFIVAATVLFSSIRLLYADIEFHKAHRLLEQQDAEASAVFVHLNRSIRSVPYHPDYAITKINMLNQLYDASQNAVYRDESWRLLEHFRTVDPHHRGILDLRVQWLKSNQNLEQSIAELKQAVAMFPWDTPLHDDAGELTMISYYEKLMGAYADLAQRQVAEKQFAEAEQVKREALDLLDDVSEKVAFLQTLSPVLEIGRLFSVSPTMLLHMGQIHFLAGDFAVSADTLRGALQDNLTISLHRSVARWYIGVLRKQGLDDPELYNRLTSGYPDEAKEIEGIARYPVPSAAERSQ